MSEFSKKLGVLIKEAVDKISALDDANFSHKPSLEKWSKKEILGHLIDSAYNNHQRFLRAEAQGNLVFQGYDQNDWVQKNDYQNRSKEDVLSTWSMANKHLARMVETLPLQFISKTTDQHNFDQICMARPEKGIPTNLVYLLDDYLFHIEHHLAQILDGNF